MIVLFDLDSDIRMFVAVLIISGISTAVAFRAASAKRRILYPDATTWDQVQGRVEHTDVSTEARGKLDVHVATVRYSYKVDGEFLSGEYAKDFFRERRAYALIDAVAPGTEVVVRCHPGDPSLSVLREEDNPGLFQGKATAGKG